MAHLPKGQGVFLPPFKSWLASNIPAVYDNTMTYYEELCALIKYLQDQVVPAVNTNASAVTTISEAVEQLQKYVEDYFTNLDVQEEINNKLDEMAENGTLQEIMAEYLSSTAFWGFDNITDMAASLNLVNGSFAKTLGYRDVNDGGGANYKIRTITNNDVVDNATIIPIGSGTLVAELICNEANLKVFGAYGDGTHNDTTVFANALDYAMEHKIDVYIPTGTYLLSPNAFQSVSRSTFYSNLVLRGDGGRESILKLNNTSTNQYLSDSTSKQLYAEIHFYEIGFTANDTTGNAFLCYSTGNEKRYYFHECLFTGMNDILTCTGTGNADIHRFYNCQFTGNYGSIVKLNNAQSVGTEMHGCHGDHYGSLVQILSGGFVNLFGCVFDFFNNNGGYVFNCSSALMGIGNYGITCNGTRFELHDGIKLIDATAHSNIGITFNDCNFGTVTTLASGYYCMIYNPANVQFNNCAIDKDLTFYLETNISYDGRGALLRFNNCVCEDRIYKQVTAHDQHCRVINNGEIYTADLGSQHGSGDFDWNFMERSVSRVTAQTKTAVLKCEGEGFPQASTSGSSTFKLPPNAFVKRIKLFRAARTGGTGTYQLHVGNSDMSVTYGETTADTSFNAEMNIDVKDLGFLSDDIIKIWATGTSTNVVTGGYGYVEYI